MADEWVYGETLCVEPHVPTCDWVYGETLCTTLPSVVYPTLSWIRVTGLVHRWRPGTYELEMRLGDLTTEFTMPDIILRPPGAAGEPEPEPVPGSCIHEGNTYPPGSIVCMGPNRFVCTEGHWMLAMLNAPECLELISTCKHQGVTYQHGETICMGPNRFVCQSGHWMLAMINAPECM